MDLKFLWKNFCLFSQKFLASMNILLKIAKKGENLGFFCAKKSFQRSWATFSKIRLYRFFTIDLKYLVKTFCLFSTKFLTSMDSLVKTIKKRQNFGFFFPKNDFREVGQLLKKLPREKFLQYI